MATGEVPPTLLERIQHNDPTLKELGGFGRHTYHEISCALRVNTTITSFKLIGSGLDDDGCTAIMKALIARRRLRRQQGPRGTEQVCDGCRPRVTRISLCRNYIGLDGAIVISEFIRLASTRLNQLSDVSRRIQTGMLCNSCRSSAFVPRGHDLMKLDLLQNRLGDEGTSVISNAILDASSSNSLTAYDANYNEDCMSSSCIVDLGLERNSIGDDGMMSIARMLQINNNLHTLRLGRNSITDDGIVNGLAPALKVNSALCVLSLMGNEIGDRGAEALGDALCFNQSLKTLLLNKCGISEAGALHILSALYCDVSPMSIQRSNHTLQDIGICKHLFYKTLLVSEDEQTTVALRELTLWNKYGPATARRLKLDFFLCSKQGPRYINAADDLELEMFPYLFYKLWKIDDICNHPGPLEVIYSYVRGMPSLFEKCQNPANTATKQYFSKPLFFSHTCWQ